MILICAASNGSNLALARRLASFCEESGLEHEVLDVVALDWPLYTREREPLGAPLDFEEVAGRFRLARAFVLCAPEYNGSIPPTLTNLVAWLSVADDDFRSLFNAKPSLIASHSGGGGAKVMFAMRTMMAHLGSDVLGRELLVNKTRPLNEDAARALIGRLLTA